MKYYFPIIFFLFSTAFGIAQQKKTNPELFLVSAKTHLVVKTVFDSVKQPEMSLSGMAEDHFYGEHKIEGTQ